MNIDENWLNHIFKPKDETLLQWIIRRVNNDHFVISRSYQTKGLQQANKVHQTIYESLVETDFDETKINLSITAYGATLILHTDPCETVPEQFEIVARHIEHAVSLILPAEQMKRSKPGQNSEKAD